MHTSMSPFLMPHNRYISTYDTRHISHNILTAYGRDIPHNIHTSHTAHKQCNKCRRGYDYGYKHTTYSPPHAIHTQTIALTSPHKYIHTDVQIAIHCTHHIAHEWPWHTNTQPFIYEHLGSRQNEPLRLILHINPYSYLCTGCAYNNTARIWFVFRRKTAQTMN